MSKPITVKVYGKPALGEEELLTEYAVPSSATIQGMLTLAKEKIAHDGFIFGRIEWSGEHEVEVRENKIYATLS